MDSPLAAFDRWRDRRSRPSRARTTLTLLLVALLAGCAERAPERAASDFSGDLANGARHVQRLADRQRLAPMAMSNAEVIAAGYVERLRLGVGSPFRLMEYALLDPRLTPSTRTPLVWALLDATRAGRGYELDPRARIRVGADPGGRDAAVARRHLELIHRAVLAAGDPRAGELAVREAYRLAAASHAVSPSAPTLAASAAALARDRELARRDAERLLAAAARSGKHPFALLVEWRTQRRFEVEAPAGAPRDAVLEDAAGRHAVRLVEQVEAARDGSGREARGRAGKPGLPRLAEAPARRLAKLAEKQPYPTQAPVWITVQRHDDELRRAAREDPSAARSVERLLERARTEEALVAEYAALGDAPAAVRESAALAALEASVAMRTYAQERVWFPGFTAPSDVDLKRAFGLRKVEFGSGVPASWRPYYRRMLWDALADLELVLPSLDLRGAAFKIGATGREGAALAIHDPYGRVIALPPESGAGAIAHEVGHDLDWQIARVRYHTRAAYGTEYAMRNGREDGFATAVRRMPVPPEVPMRGGAEAQRRYAQRPPEIFARAFDGYVAAALAERGRSNGYLTAAQDEFLGGHGLALTLGARDDAVPFMEMLMVASPVPEAERAEFLARRAAGRVPTAFETASRITARAPAALPPPPATRPAPGMAGLLAAGERVRAEAAAVMAHRDSAIARWSVARCASPFTAHGPRGEASVRRLADAAAAARIRGIVLLRARALGLEAAPPWLADAWLASPPQPDFAEASGGAATWLPREAPACGGTG
jgi:hypothetical protein